MLPDPKPPVPYDPAVDDTDDSIYAYPVFAIVPTLNLPIDEFAALANAWSSIDAASPAADHRYADGIANAPVFRYALAYRWGEE